VKWLQAVAWGSMPLDGLLFQMWKALYAQSAMYQSPPREGESDEDYVKRIRALIKAPIDERRSHRKAAIN
jgi:hypothetical protein